MNSAADLFTSELPRGQSIDLLSDLRDVQLPPISNELELAPGWWILSVLLIALIFFLVWLFAKKWKKNEYRREALVELEAIHSRHRQTGDDLVFLQETQNLLKRVALTAFPREQVAQLTDIQWIHFLGKSSESDRFEGPNAEALIDDIYREKLERSLNHREIEVLARFWIKNHKTALALEANKHD